MKKIGKILAANRSEIAIRIFRAAEESGIKTAAIYSKEDRFAIHRFKTDESYLVGEGKGPIQAYLDIDSIIKIAKDAKVDAIHPGYGFLSENANFAKILEENKISWGIITNKPAFLTDPLVEKLGLADRAACVVSGDTTAHSKPHPAPMLHDCSLINHLPKDCLYIGDAKRDIEAGKNARMKTITARWGYLGKNDKPENWQADAIIDHPSEILQWI